MNYLNTKKVIFGDLVACSRGVYNFILFKSNIKIFFIPSLIINASSNFW